MLKLHAAGTDAAWLDLQDAAMAHVAGRTGDVATPRLRPARDGAARVATGDGVARVLTWVPGTPWAGLPEHDAEALASLGRAVAHVDAALADFEHPALDRPLAWNMLRASALRDDASGVAAAVLARFATELEPALRALPAQAIHNDANEHNVLVGADGRVSGLIDFGDLCRAPRVCGLAVAGAYAMTLLPVPEREVLPLVAGYHEVAPLSRGGARAAPRPDPHTPGDERGDGRAPAPGAARQRLPPDQPGRRHGAARPPRRDARRARAAAPARRVRLRARPDGPRRPRRTSRPPIPARSAARRSRTRRSSTSRAPAPDAPTIEPSLGRYLEDRRVYDSDAFVAELPGERRTLHLGVDVFLPAGEPILAPLDGTVRDVAFRPAARDWGGIVVLDHVTADGVRFHTLYGHLSQASVRAARARRRVARGDVSARLGDETENGGWAPHLHFQLLTTDLGRGCDVARRRHARRARPVGVARAPTRTWCSACRVASAPTRRAIATTCAPPARSRCRARSASPTPSR